MKANASAEITHVWTRCWTEETGEEKALSLQPQAFWPRHHSAMCDYHMGMGSCYNTAIDHLTLTWLLVGVWELVCSSHYGFSNTWVCSGIFDHDRVKWPLVYVLIRIIGSERRCNALWTLSVQLSRWWTTYSFPDSKQQKAWWCGHMENKQLIELLNSGIAVSLLKLLLAKFIYAQSMRTGSRIWKWLSGEWPHYTEADIYCCSNNHASGSQCLW